MRDPRSNARIEKLHPKYRSLFRDFVEECEETLDITLRVVQGFRTFAEQQAIFDQPHDGKDNDGDGKIDEKDERVTNAPAGKSFHNYGIAVDLVQMLGAAANWNFAYKQLVPIANKYNLEWGGTWVTIHDEPHFQVKGYNIQDLYRRYLKKDFIEGTDYLNL